VVDDDDVEGLTEVGGVARLGDRRMKVAVTGKGGVGKTTVAAYLARCWRVGGSIAA